MAGQGGRGFACSKPSPGRLRPPLLLWPTISGIIAAEKGAEFQEAIHQQAKPEVDHGSQVDRPRVVLCGGRQVRRKRKIQAVAEQDGDQKFYPFGARKRHGCNYRSEIGAEWRTPNSLPRPKFSS